MTNIELINLTLNEIRRSAQAIAECANESRIISGYQTGETPKSLLAETSESCENALKYCRLALRDVLEHIAEFQNSRNMVEGVDAALGKVAYDLIYERTDWEDYEPRKEQ